MAALSRALDEARAELRQLRARVRTLERQLPQGRCLPKRPAARSLARHLVDEAVALSKYGCSSQEIAERLRVRPTEVEQVLQDPQRARRDAPR